MFALIAIAADRVLAAFPGLTVPWLLLAFFVLLWLWAMAFAVFVWTAGPVLRPTGDRLWFLLSRWAAVPAVIMPPLIAFAAVTNSEPAATFSVVVLVLSVGAALLAHNIAVLGRGVFGVVIPTIGVVAAISFIAVAALIVMSSGDFRAIADSVALIQAMVFYIGWATWAGCAYLEGWTWLRSGLVPLRRNQANPRTPSNSQRSLCPKC